MLESNGLAHSACGHGAVIRRVVTANRPPGSRARREDFLPPTRPARGRACESLTRRREESSPFFSAPPRLRVSPVSLFMKRNHRPNRSALLANTPHSLLHLIRKPSEIDSPVVLIRCDEQQPLLDPLHRRTPLTHLRVMDPYAELEEDADEVGLVADAFEEKLLEAIACFEVLAVVEEGDAADEAWVPDQFNDQFQVSDRS